MRVPKSLLCLLLILPLPVAAQVRVTYWGTGGAETIRLRLHNCTNQTATHQVWAGEAHPCILPAHQPLVTGQDLSFELAPGEKKEVLVPVYCGNSFVPCPWDGLQYLCPSKPYPQLRSIILANAGQPWQTQELIWELTNRDRLPESGPPTFLEVVMRRGEPVHRGRAPALMCLGVSQWAEQEPPSRTQQQGANVRAMGLIGLFLLVPTPLAVIFVLAWLLVPTRRRPGPRHA